MVKHNDIMKYFLSIQYNVFSFTFLFVYLFQSALFRNDMKLVNEPLMYHVNLITTAEQKNFFDLLHFSPLKVYSRFKIHIYFEENKIYLLFFRFIYRYTSVFR